MFHERFGYRVNVDGQFHRARWIILWLPIALAVGGLALSMIWRISHRLVIGPGIGANVFLAGAAGMEVLNSSYRFGSESALAVAHEGRFEPATPGAPIAEAGGREGEHERIP